MRSRTSREGQPVGFILWRTHTTLSGGPESSDLFPISVDEDSFVTRILFHSCHFAHSLVIIPNPFSVFIRLYRVYGKKNIKLESVPAKASSLDPR